MQHSGINIHSRWMYNISTNLRNDGEWIEYLARQYTVTLEKGTNKALWYMIRLVDMPHHEFLTLVALNMESVDWVYVCGAHIPRGHSRVCEEFHHLTHLTEISPSARSKRRTLRVNLHELMKSNPIYTHVVVRVLPTEEPMILHFDVHSIADRKISIDLPNLMSLQRQIIMNVTNENIVHLELILPQFQHIRQYYQLNVQPIECSHEFHHATASLITPWSDGNIHGYFTETYSQTFQLRLHQSRPHWASNQSAYIQLTLDPACRYSLSIQSSIPGMLGQLARFYSPQLIGNIAAVILMALNSQLKSIHMNQHCSFLFAAIKEGAKPYYILTAVKLISRFFSSNSLIPSPDWKFVIEEGTDFLLLPLLLYICSVGIVYLFAIGLCISLVTFETTIYKFVLRFLSRTFSFNIALSDYVMSALHKVPMVVVGILISLTFSTSGALALNIGMVFYFLKLIHLSQDFIEDLVWYYLNKIIRKMKRNSADEKIEDEYNSKILAARNSMFFHTTIFMLWSILTVINIPSVLTWAKHFRFSTVLRPDPAFVPGLALSLCAFPLWQMNVPKMEREWYMEISHFTIVLAVLSLVYAPISIYRLNYTVTAAIVSITLHQLLSKNREDLITKGENSDVSSQHDSYELVKAKLE